jgi:hypothetical protein
MALDFLSVPPMSDVPERAEEGLFHGRGQGSSPKMLRWWKRWRIGLIPPDKGMKETLEEFAEIESESDVDSSDNEDEC